MLRQRYICPMVTLCISWLFGLSMFNECALAQEEQTNTPVKVDVEKPSQEFLAFSEMCSESENALRESTTWRVDIDALLTSGIEAKTIANLHLSLLSQAPLFRLEVRDKPNDRLQFLALHRDASLLRFAAQANQYSRVSSTEPMAEMQACGLSQLYLETAGVTFLFMPEPSEVLFGKITHVFDLGVDSRGRHFRLTHNDGDVVDFWFSNNVPRLPVAIRFEKTLALDEGQEIRFARSTSLKWTLDQKLADDAFKFELPASAKEVDDLAASASDRGTEALLGQALPTLNLLDLQGQAINWDKVDRPTLLYFWATWAAPSVDQIPSVLEYAEQLKARGVQIRLINVADTPQQVHDFLSANRIVEDVVLDHDGNAAHDLRLTNLPCVVLVGRDQTISAIYQKVNADSRSDINAQIETLLAAPEK